MSPGIMFLDEPTSGLDSTNAAKVVDILSGLGAMGTTVLLSIHQPRPDIFRLLDRVLVLSGDGSVVYSGPSALASAHFSSLSFVSLPAADLHIADYMLDVVLKSPRSDVRKMVQVFAESAQVLLQPTDAPRTARCLIGGLAGAHLDGLHRLLHRRQQPAQ